MDINYLSLKLAKNYWEVQSTSQAIKHRCYFPKDNGRYNHQLHTENAQLNTIIDLQITQAESLREFNHICTDLWKTVHTEMLTKNLLLRNIHENQEYIKNQYENQEYIKNLFAYRRGKILYIISGPLPSPFLKGQDAFLAL